jgi:hypothetical protein
MVMAQGEGGGPPLGSANAQKHGGASAEKALAQGEPFRHMAAIEQQVVTKDLEDLGTVEMLRTGAVRLETVARLYWAAICQATETRDIEMLDRYAKRFGWLQNSAIRAWERLNLAQKSQDHTVIDAALEVTNGKD